MRTKALILIAAGLIGVSSIAWAQIAPLRPTPQIAPQISQQGAANIQAVQSVESLQAEITRLKAKIKTLEAEKADLQNHITQMTSKGGSEVRAFCSTDLKTSQSTAGATEDCTFSGYMCSPVSGLCLRSCNTSDDCYPSHLCDTSINKCVPHP